MCQASFRGAEESSDLFSAVPLGGRAEDVFLPPAPAVDDRLHCRLLEIAYEVSPGGREMLGGRLSLLAEDCMMPCKVFSLHAKPQEKAFSCSQSVFVEDDFLLSILEVALEVDIAYGAPRVGCGL